VRIISHRISSLSLILRAIVLELHLCHKHLLVLGYTARYSVIRLRETVVEIERVKDYVFIVCHRPVCRVLIAYFMDLTRNSIAIADLLPHVPFMARKYSFVNTMGTVSNLRVPIRE
jgi:hypothetical protein